MWRLLNWFFFLNSNKRLNFICENWIFIYERQNAMWIFDCLRHLIFGDLSIANRILLAFSFHKSRSYINGYGSFGIPDWRGRFECKFSNNSYFISVLRDSIFEIFKKNSREIYWMQLRCGWLCVRLKILKASKLVFLRYVQYVHCSCLVRNWLLTYWSIFVLTFDSWYYW